MSIKDILDRHNKKVDAIDEIKDEEGQKFHDSEERAKSFIRNVISPALQSLKEEFETDGVNRKVSIELKPESFFAAITIMEETVKEFYYELNLRVNETDFWVKVVYHHIKRNGTFNYIPEQDLNLRKPLAQVTEADIRNDFYQRYDQYMLLKEPNL